MQEEGITKLYYAIGEVSDMTGLEPHVLRYWESEFEMLQPRKNRAGRRVYTEEDIAMVRRIQHLLRVDKYTIAGARQVLERGEAPETIDDEGEELLRLRGFLQDLLQKLENRVD
jgi:DNA-binding transcriptional MerR regulator